MTRQLENRAYNTCAGYDYNNKSVQRRMVGKDGRAPRGAYDDQIAFVERADELALSLLEEGFTAMKIWPFDNIAAATDGQFVSGAQMREGLEPFEKIRRAVGDRMEVTCEFHSMWNVTSAIAIARELRQYRPFRAEDPIKMDGVQALADYRRQAGIPGSWRRCTSHSPHPMPSFRRSFGRSCRPSIATW